MRWFQIPPKVFVERLNFAKRKVRRGSYPHTEQSTEQHIMNFLIGKIGEWIAMESLKKEWNIPFRIPKDNLKVGGIHYSDRGDLKVYPDTNPLIIDIKSTVSDKIKLPDSEYKDSHYKKISFIFAVEMKEERFPNTYKGRLVGFRSVSSFIKLHGPMIFRGSSCYWAYLNEFESMEKFKRWFGRR